MKACILPSASSACDLTAGKPGAWPRVVMHTAGRALLIGLGISAAGEMDPRKVGRYALGAAVAIEIFALTWAAYHQRKRR